MVAAEGRDTSHPRVVVFGAGAIGCWVGGTLAAAGVPVTLVGRPRVMAELERGVRVIELDGTERTAQLALATEPSAARDADVVLVTVKSAATAEAASLLGGVVPDGCAIVSLQNGIRNAEILRASLSGKRVVTGMVEFNVVRAAPGTYRRTTSGRLMFERSDAGARLVAAGLAAGIACEQRDDMRAVQWAKLVLNLNNAINALSNVPLASGSHSAISVACSRPHNARLSVRSLPPASRSRSCRRCQRHGCHACCPCPTGYSRASRSASLPSTRPRARRCGMTSKPGA